MLRMHFSSFVEFHFLKMLITFPGYLRPDCVDKLRVWHSTCETDTNSKKKANSFSIIYAMEIESRGRGRENL